MGLADKLEEQKPDDRPPFRRQVEKLAPADFDALMSAAKDPAWSNAKLREVLIGEGFVVSKETFANWRRNVTSR